ncbi:MAG TPA: ABC transporter ATP-binding protein [Longimicrobiales bacterium]|nr:ABC transporter ATP-binding protein [Longimicrobiales bacterium]
MIRIRGLRKSYGRTSVLDGVDLDIAAGQVTAILGPNGAGKTTLIKSCLGLVHPDAGEISIGGVSINGDAEYRRRIGYMPQVPRYPENLTVREILAMIRDLRGGNEGDLDTEMMDVFALETQMDKPFRALSGGNRQRVSAAIAFMFRPPLLFLDEPTAGLDPVASSTLKDRIRREKEQGRTVILTSHVMSEIEELADVVIYLLDGRIDFERSVNDLMHGTGEATLERAIARMMIRAVA